MHHHTQLSFVDKFRWVSPLHYLKKTDSRTLFFFGACCKWGAISTLLLRCHVAILHRTVTWRPLFKPRVSLLSTYWQSSCVSNFYRTFKVFMLTLPRIYFPPSPPPNHHRSLNLFVLYITLTMLTWRIWWAPNNARRWQAGFNSAFKGLSTLSVN